MDESFYYTVTQRFAHGDRMLIDEWYPTQLSAMLEIIPYRIAYSLCAGTEGIILCLRYMYILVKIPIAFFMWIHLRRYHLFGLMSVLTYVSYIDFDITATFSYHTASTDGMIVVCMILVFSEKLTPMKMLFTGFVYACVVLAQPFSVFLYVLYTLSVFILLIVRKRRETPAKGKDFLVSVKAWLFFSAGCFLCAIPFFVFLIKNSDIRQIIRMLPIILSDPDYSLNNGYDGKFRLLGKILRMLKVYNGVITVAAVSFIAVYLIGKALLKGKSLLIFKQVCRIAGFAVCASLFILLIRDYQLEQGIIAFFFAPHQLIAFIALILCERKPKPAIMLFVIGIMLSAFIDTSSQSILAYGGFLTQIRFFISAYTIIHELLAEKPSDGKEKISRLASICACIAVIVSVLVWQATFVRTQISVPCAEGINEPIHLPEMSAVIEKGPQKGLRTTPRVKEVLSTLYEDIDELKYKEAGNIYFYNRYPQFYLYANVKYTCSSTWSSRSSALERQIQYWTVFPERAPNYIYISSYDYNYFTPLRTSEINETLSQFGKYFDFNMTKGRAGIILTVTDVKFK